MYPGIETKHFYDSQAFRDKVVIVSGASRGIGEEIARTYARAGASLSLLARSLSALQSVKATIESELSSSRVEVFETDVTDPKAVENAVRSTVEKFGKVDIVVANAGKTSRWDQCVFITPLNTILLCQMHFGLLSICRTRPI